MGPRFSITSGMEQPDKVDARADIYAVATVGYYLLTGSLVFTGNFMMEICMKHINEIPQPLPARRGELLSPDLEALLLRCLAKSLSDRPTDAADLLRQLGRVGYRRELDSLFRTLVDMI